MFKHLIVAAAILTLGLGYARAAEMSLPGSAPSAAAAETDNAIAGARNDAAYGSAMHASTQRGVDATHARLQPDAIDETHGESKRTFPAGDAMSGAEASQRRHHTHWQSLLPGVMK
jgi:hypothetical protein